MAVLVLAPPASSLNAAPRSSGVQGTPIQRDAPVEFLREAQVLFRVAACGPGPRERHYPRRTTARHCRSVAKRLQRYRARWETKAKPLLATMVPQGLPRTVIYPFGGVDLLTVLTVFPDADDITTLSLEPSGDPRPFLRMRNKQLRAALARVRSSVRSLTAVSHSRTIDLVALTKRRVPGHLVVSLLALAHHGYVPTSVRYFRLEPGGAITYLTAADTAGVRDRKQLRRLFASVEIRFRRAGQSATPPRVFRHIRADLSDASLNKDNRVLVHLKAKGRVVAMTKAASYLLAKRSFSRIRGYLLTNMDWMISDSTGIPPRYAKPAGFVQETWGQYHGAGLSLGRHVDREYVALWRKYRGRKLSFWFGYPDRKRHGHLMVTKRAP